MTDSGARGWFSANNRHPNLTGMGTGHTVGSAKLTGSISSWARGSHGLQSGRALGERAGSAPQPLTLARSPLPWHLAPLPYTAAPQPHPPARPCPGASTLCPTHGRWDQRGPQHRSLHPHPDGASPSHLPLLPACAAPSTLPLAPAPGVDRHWPQALGARGQSGSRQQLPWWQATLSPLTLQTLGGDTFIALPRP